MPYIRFSKDYQITLKTQIREEEKTLDQKACAFPFRKVQRAEHI